VTKEILKDLIDQVNDPDFLSFLQIASLELLLNIPYMRKTNPKIKQKNELEA
jgi:hypothetical protein